MKEKAALGRGRLFLCNLTARLEGELSHHLQNPSAGQGTRERAVWRGRWAGGLQNRTEHSRTIARRIDRVLEVRVIQHVVRIRSELKCHPLCYAEVLPQAEVGVEIIRPTESIPADVAKPGRRWIAARIARTG